MERKTKGAACCAPGGDISAGWRVESLIAVDDRGQMVLPKDLRDRACIKGGDKFALISWEKDGRVCCLSLIQVEAFRGMIQGLLGPLMGDLLRKG